MLKDDKKYEIICLQKMKIIERIFVEKAAEIDEIVVLSDDEREESTTKSVESEAKEESVESATPEVEAKGGHSLNLGDLSELKFRDLQVLAKKYNISAKGRKEELVYRVMEYVQSGGEA